MLIDEKSVGLEIGFGQRLSELGGIGKSELTARLQRHHVEKVGAHAIEKPRGNTFPSHRLTHPYATDATDGRAAASFARLALVVGELATLGVRAPVGLGNWFGQTKSGNLIGRGRDEQVDLGHRRQSVVGIGGIAVYAEILIDV